MSFASPQSVKLLLAMSKADTDGGGLADAIIKVPGTFGDQKARTIEGGFGCFKNQEPGDYLKVELRDDDNLLGYGAGTVLNSFHDTDVPAVNRGWYFLGTTTMDLKPVVSDDPTELPAGMYLHIMAQKADTATADTLYINLHWGNRIR